MIRTVAAAVLLTASTVGGGGAPPVPEKRSPLRPPAVQLMSIAFADSAAKPDRGAKIDLSGFRYHRPLSDGAEGLVVLRLDAAVLSHSRGPASGFADIRIVDETGFQIPYLLERHSEPLSMNLPVRSIPAPAALPERRGNRSVYGITLPYENLPDARLVLETSDRVFRRTLEIGVQRPPDRQRRDVRVDVLARRHWQHADPAAPAPALEIPLAVRDVRELLVVVDEGDNQPLPITAARVVLPAWGLRFIRPAGPLRLVYGSTDAAPPRYDLVLMAPTIVDSPAAEITAQAEVPTGETATHIISPPVFWIGLTLAVVVLLALIARLLVR